MGHDITKTNDQKIEQKNICSDPHKRWYKCKKYELL